jgi:ribonuclease P protein component
MSTGKNTFSKNERICNDKQISRLFEQGSSFICYPVRVVWIENDEPSTKPVRILISVSKKKIRHAVDRNRVKRLIRESYRINKSELYQWEINTGKSIGICFIWLSDDLVDFSKVDKKMHDALGKILLKVSEKNECS